MHPLQNTTTPIPEVALEEVFHDCYESEEFIKFQYTVDDLLLAASTASTVFNFLVLFCAFKLFKRSGDTMHLFIINMTLGDLLLTVFCHPNEVLTRKHAFLQHVHLCAVIHFGNWLGLAVSGLSLTLLNVDKLIYFLWPLKYDEAMSKRRAIILCIFIWVVSLGFVSYVWIFNIVYVSADCMLQMADEKKYYYEIFMIMFCVLPVTSSLIVSAYLFRLIRQKINARPPLVSGDHNIDTPTFKTKMKSLMFIFATTAWTSFSLLPYRIFNICRIHLFEWNSIGCEQRVIMNWLAWILIYLLTLNPIVNPLITSIVYAPYRLTLKKLLINIPIGNRLQYTYRGEATETSYLSVRRTRTRTASTDQELNSIRKDADESQRQSLNSSVTASSSSNGAAGTLGNGERLSAPPLLIAQESKYTPLLHNGFKMADSSDEFSTRSSIKSSPKSLTVKIYVDEIDKNSSQSLESSTSQTKRHKNISFQSIDAATDEL
ncbi:7 transmembrane receptor (rhodopsin family) domain-containing protein [Ditylenchus destructor]|nr:7 transmembrane receptor (rhodopsin family) domain-containing protein [Ditylenchus destructor]